MSRCIHVYPFVARNHGGMPFSGVCPLFYFFICMLTAAFLWIYVLHLDLVLTTNRAFVKGVRPRPSCLTSSRRVMNGVYMRFKADKDAMDAFVLLRKKTGAGKREKAATGEPVLATSL